MVYTGAIVSLIKPEISKAQVQACNVQARGVSGTRLDVSGKQEVEFTIRTKQKCMTLHTFVVSPLDICSTDILGLDFLQRVGAEISLTSRSLTIDNHLFPLSDFETVGLERPASGGQRWSGWGHISQSGMGE
jgi:hypothetical protein